MDPATERVVYVGSTSDYTAGKTGAFFKSTDGGATGKTLLQGITVRDIDIDPLHPDILYVTCGINALTPPGIVKSTDGGHTWTWKNRGMQLSWEERPGVLVMHPVQPKTLYAGTGGIFGGTIYKSENGGEQWRPIDPPAALDPLEGGVISIVLDPADPNIIYAGTSWGGGIHKSADGGHTWQLAGLEDTGLIHDLVIPPDSPATVLAAVYGSARKNGVFASRDGGATWQEANSGLPDTVGVWDIESTSREIFIVAREGVYRSPWQPVHWESIAWEKNPEDLTYTTIKILEDRDMLLVGTDGYGLYELTF